MILYVYMHYVCVICWFRQFDATKNRTKLGNIGDDSKEMNSIPIYTSLPNLILQFDSP